MSRPRPRADRPVGRTAGDAGGGERRHRRRLPHRHPAGAGPALAHADRALVSVGFIEFVRGVPLITVLFMASVMLPLFLPESITIDKLLRALIMVALFSAAYLAEVIRGGLQAIPRGQFEAADALGLTYAQKMGLIVLPQALKLVIPGIVNTFIGLFKDTSLVLIIGIFDLLGIVQLGLPAQVAVAGDADDGLHLRRPGVLDLLLRHLALLADDRTLAGAGGQKVVQRPPTSDAGEPQVRCLSIVERASTTRTPRRPRHSRKHRPGSCACVRRGTQHVLGNRDRSSAHRSTRSGHGCMGTPRVAKACRWRAPVSACPRSPEKRQRSCWRPAAGAGSGAAAARRRHARPTARLIYAGPKRAADTPKHAAHKRAVGAPSSRRRAPYSARTICALSGNAPTSSRARRRRALPECAEATRSQGPASDRRRSCGPSSRRCLHRWQPAFPPQRMPASRQLPHRRAGRGSSCGARKPRQGAIRFRSTAARRRPQELPRRSACSDGPRRARRRPAGKLPERMLRATCAGRADRTGSRGAQFGCFRPRAPRLRFSIPATTSPIASDAVSPGLSMP